MPSIRAIVSVVTVNVMNLTFLVSAWQKED
jgi:hypothetical protein